MAQLGNGVSVAELATMLNVKMEAKAICTAVRINKWSKKKPVHYSSTGPLTDAQFRGMSTDISQGIIYGLKAGVARTSVANLHAANWEYVGRPQGGIPNSPYRIDDFWGYEKDIEYPTMSGSGLYNEQKVLIADDAVKIYLNWTTGLTSVVDLAEVYSAYTNQTPNYSSMYLCALVGTRARALYNVDAGGIYPILHNDVQCKTFHLPSTASFLSADETLPVTLFFANLADINTNVGGVTMRNGWVDFSPATAPAFTSLFVTLPEQVNITVKFVLTIIQYIKAFSLVYDSRSQAFSFDVTKGDDWDKANAYRVRITVKKAGISSEGPATYVDVPKDLFIPLTTLNTIMGNAGYVQDGKAADYTFTATFTVQASQNGSYVDTTFSDSITLNLTSW